MNDTLRPLFEDALKKARDIYVVIGALLLAGGVGLLALGAFVPAKNPQDRIPKAAMMVFAVALVAGGSWRMHRGRIYEQQVRDTFANATRVRGLTLVQVKKGRSITWAFHLDVGETKPLILPVLNRPAFEAMVPLVRAHFPNAQSKS